MIVGVGGVVSKFNYVLYFENGEKRGSLQAFSSLRLPYFAFLSLLQVLDIQ